MENRDAVVGLILDEEELLVDDLKMILEDMRSNASYKDAQKAIQTIKNAFSSIKYQLSKPAARLVYLMWRLGTDEIAKQNIFKGERP